MLMLGWARVVVSQLSFDRWQGTLGKAGVSGEPRSDASLTHARRLAAHVDWAASRLPFATKCLPRAIALSWMLRRRNLCHMVVIAVRPAELRNSADAMHAWVEVEGQRIIGDLPGPWLETLRLGA